MALTQAEIDAYKKALGTSATPPPKGQIGGTATATPALNRAGHDVVTPRGVVHLPGQAPPHDPGVPIPEPVQTFMGKAGAVMETPFTLLGATISDADRGRSSLTRNEIDAYGKIIGKKMPPRPASAYETAEDLIGQGNFAQAARQYSITSPEANKYRAQTGHDPTATFLHHHPFVQSLVSGAEEAVSPSNIALGEATGVVGRTLGAVGRTAGKTVTRAAQAAGVPATNSFVSRAAASLSEHGGSRFAEPRAAAADIARQKPGGNPNEAAARADAMFTRLAQAPGNAHAAGVTMVKKVAKGMTKAEAQELPYRVEGTPRQKFSPEGEARLAKGVQEYRARGAALDQETTGSGVTLPGRLLDRKTYFPRGRGNGAFTDPNLHLSEEAEDFIDSHHGGGGMGVRKDTLSDSIPPRKWDTLAQAEWNGAPMNKEWNPLDTLYTHVRTRAQSAAIMRELPEAEKLGLITPMSTKNMWGHDIPFTANPATKDFVPWTKIGDVRSFGSGAEPALKNYAVHPSFAHGIADITNDAVKAGQGLTSWWQVPAQVGRLANYLLSRSETGNFVYHPLENLDQNIITDLPNPVGLVKGAIKGSPEGRAVGASTDYAPPGNPADWTRPWSDLSPKEIAARLVKTPERVLNAVTSDPLYGPIEKRMAEAHYEGMRGRGLSPSESMLKTRQMVGGRENLGAGASGVAQALQFPAWTLSTLRNYIPKLLKNPGLYTAPHRAVATYNQSRGVEDTNPSSGSMLIPPFVNPFNPRDAHGNANMVSLPSPANRALQAISILGELATGNPGAAGRQAQAAALSIANPVLNTVGKWYHTNDTKYAGFPSSTLSFDRDAPESQTPLGQLKQVLSGAGQRYTPVRGGLPGFLGIQGQTELTPQNQKRKQKLETHKRERIEELRGKAKKMTAAGRPEKAAELNAKADKVYDAMVKAMQAKGYIQP